jgi:hypothetical protein
MVYNFGCLPLREGLDAIMDEIRKASEDSEVGRLYALVKWSFVDAEKVALTQKELDCMFTNFLFYTVLGGNGYSGFRSRTNITNDVLSERLQSWMQKEAHFARKRYLEECEKREVLPEDTSLKDWNTAKSTALMYVGYHCKVLAENPEEDVVEMPVRSNRRGGQYYEIFLDVGPMRKVI